MITPWTIPGSTLCKISHFLANNCKSVLELGSGDSTVKLAQLLINQQIEALISVEHLPFYAAQVNGLISSVPGFMLLKTDLVKDWYDLGKNPFPFQFDGVLVDGPPGHQFPYARWPAYPRLKTWATPDAWFLLDDYDRNGEKVIAQAWQNMEEGLTLIEVIDDRIAVMRRGQT